jgi:hypothetical protein
MTVLASRSFVRAVVCLAIIATADDTAAQASSSDTSAKHVYAACKAFEQNQPISDPQVYNLEGFCSGVVHGLAGISSSLAVELQSCVPPASTPAELALVVVKFLDEHPERMNEDFRLLVLEAFHNAWPCS